MKSLTKPPFKFLIDIPVRSIVVPRRRVCRTYASSFWASFVYVAYRTELFFDEVFFVLRVTQRVALLDETKNGSGVALRDEGKNGSSRRLSMSTVTLAVAFFTDGISGGLDEP